MNKCIVSKRWEVICERSFSEYDELHFKVIDKYTSKTNGYATLNYILRGKPTLSSVEEMILMLLSSFNVQSNTTSSRELIGIFEKIFKGTILTESITRKSTELYEQHLYELEFEFTP